MTLLVPNPLKWCTRSKWTVTEPQVLMLCRRTSRSSNNSTLREMRPTSSSVLWGTWVPHKPCPRICQKLSRLLSVMFRMLLLLIFRAPTPQRFRAQLFKITLTRQRIRLRFTWMIHKRLRNFYWEIVHLQILLLWIYPAGNPQSARFERTASLWATLLILTKESLETTMKIELALCLISCNLQTKRISRSGPSVVSSAFSMVTVATLVLTFWETIYTSSS